MHRSHAASLLGRGPVPPPVPTVPRPRYAVVDESLTSIVNRSGQAVEVLPAIADQSTDEAETTETL